jgi:hypothetical protein
VSGVTVNAAAAVRLLGSLSCTVTPNGAEALVEAVHEYVSWYGAVESLPLLAMPGIAWKSTLVRVDVVEAEAVTVKLPLFEPVGA